MPSSVIKISSFSPPRIVNFEEKSVEDTPGKRATALVMSSAHDIFLMSSPESVSRDKLELLKMEKLPGVTVISRKVIAASDK